MSLLDAALCFALTYLTLWGLWTRFFQPPQTTDRWASAEEIRDAMRPIEPPLYDKRSWKN